MEGAEDNRQEKTSVFQKAKAKARKMKDTIKMKTGHGQDLGNTNQNDQGHEEEEDEQMVDDSEVHDTVPKYDSPAVTSTVAGQKKPDDKLGKPATAAEDQYGSKYTDAQTRPSSQWPDENTDNRGVDTARPTGMGTAGVQVPKNRDGLFSSSGALGVPGSESAGNFVHGDGGHMGDPKISSETPAAMEEDPYKPDYQSKVADPTGAGGEEAGINSIMKSFNKLNVDDGEPESKPISERAPETYTESQDHFSQEPILPTSTINPDDPGSISKSFDGDKPEDAPLDNVTNLPSNQSSYAQKIPYADKAIAAKNVVASKLGYGSTEDPTASPKATQGGEEIGKPGTTTDYGQKIVAPESFNKVNADDGEPESKPISERAPETYTESQDHFSQEPIPPTSTINSDHPGSISKSFDGDKPEDAPLDNVTKLPSSQSSYAQKIPYADKAIAAKNVVTSKLGYGSTKDPTASPKATQGGEETGKPGTTTEYGQKIVAPESFNKVNADDGEPESKPISERAPETYTESQDRFSPEPIPHTSTINPDDPGSISKSFDGDKPEDTPLDNVTNPPPNQSSYTEKISYATSAITDTAIAAKNVVASKLGYGSTVDPTASPKATQGGEEIGKPGTTTVYEKVSNAGSSVVTPLYGKVSNVGSSVVSKVRGTGTKQDQGVEGQDQGDEGQDQGMPVKGYLAEKLRPSDDDKALSEVISDTLHNRKQEVDVEEEGENQKPAVGTVTESEEVRERLGSDEGNRGMTETESKAAANASPTGKGMVESVKGTVTSWFSRGGDQKQTSEASPGTIPEEERLSSSTGEEAVGHGQSGVGEPGEGRLQESGK